ncbi:MAG: hypothetical protein ABR985_15245 [Methanotrichaceae archaeon]|jgi:hypothetical protein
MIKWSWKREARIFEPRQKVNSRLLELETAKSILAEVFHARPSDVEDMIQKRREENSWIDKRPPDEEQWPREFCLDE